ncbi:uncharacterized protein LOC110858884 isoform X2 [Folsomia candida]|uniref:uncharacterized protein LOC110858884 isoform X2 n=1 Tax=Folsomia candida TaxID=158441 RepID=UPI001604A9A8|nr:uncharacterized protein LOC110858884 isoform X2 [Folsomia candida]
MSTFLLRNIIKVALMVFLIISIADGNPVREKDYVPSMARKAGGGYRKRPTETPPMMVDTDGKIEEINPNKTDDFWMEYDEDVEEDCPSSEFWHIRANRCVPLICGGGRDPETGQCMHLTPSINMFGNNRHGFRYPHVGATNWNFHKHPDTGGHGI